MAQIIGAACWFSMINREPVIYHHLEAPENQNVWRSRVSPGSSGDQLVSEYTNMSRKQCVGWQTPAALWTASERRRQCRMKPVLLWKQIFRIWPEEQDFLVLVHQRLGMEILGNLFYFSLPTVLKSRKGLKKCSLGHHIKPAMIQEEAA